MTIVNSGYERKNSDAYYTPSWVTQALMDYYPELEGPIWEPACGEGHIVNILSKKFTVVGSDINHSPPEFGENACVDFLDETLFGKWAVGRKNIVTNPPYGKRGILGEKFVRHALTMVNPTKGIVAMLLPNEWDAAKTRRDLFDGFSGRVTKIVLRQRIRWANLEQKKSGPTQNHAWYIWDYRYEKSESGILKWV